MSFCFTAAEARLALLLPGAPGGDAIDAALALAAHEPLVAALVEALGHDLDPAPAAAAPAGLLWAEAEGGARLGCSWPLLREMRAAPALALAWPELEFEVDVAGFDEMPLPAGAGRGVLLLPGAFEPPWRVALHARGTALAAEAEWSGPGAPLAPTAPPEAGAAPRAPWRVQLAETWRARLPALLGWERLAAPRPGAAAALVGPEGAARQGRIAPALSGAGLLVE